MTRGETEASSFVIFITYLAQLYGPLNQLGYIYRSVNQSLVDTEKLLALLNEPTDINDKPGAPDLVVTEGEIEFRKLVPLHMNASHYNVSSYRECDLHI